MTDRFAFQLPDDAPPDLEAVKLLGAGLDDLRAAVADLATDVADLQERAANGAAPPPAAVPGSLSWADLDRPAASTLWVWLIRWMQWLIRRYPVMQDIPACWARHPALVEELTALAAAWHAAYAPNSQPQEPLRWHEAFARARVRLREWDDHTRCRHTGHTPLSNEYGWPSDWRDDALEAVDADLAGRRVPERTGGEPT
ncbi:hypothetical protein AB0M46_13705 [Dactylosporangium sp. NPDC051485]|uniref:hypothetical protein n=1 Tax=Dactylosporangium sp. NPDC051485 TaxID=3154846 RepID=UPI0034150EF3